MKWMALLLVTAFTAASGCVGMDVEVEAENGPDGQGGGANGSSFTHGENVRFESDTDRYDWENTGTRAAYSFYANLYVGNLTVSFLDADGTRVGRVSVTGPGQASKSETTSEGAPGTWTVVIKKDGMSGQYGLNAYPR